MGQYTDIELKEMAKTEPERAFYFSHEDEFMKMGIDLTLDNWDSVLQTSMVPSPHENRYAFFMRSLRDGGVTVLDGDNNLHKLQLDDTKKDPLVVTELEDVPDALPQFRQEPPTPPQRPHLGFGARLLQLLTIGAYKPKELREYDRNMQEFNRQTSNYTKQKEAFDKDTLKTHRAKSLAMAEYEKTLAARGKTPEMRENYRKALKKKTQKLQADNEKIQSMHSSVVNSLTDKTRGRETLDFIFGPKVSPEKTKEMIKKCGAPPKVFSDDCFGAPQDGDKHQRLKDYDMPKDCPFDAHALALFGYSATCTYEASWKAAMQPDPDKPPVVKELSNDEKINWEVLWYNVIDGIITRSPRQASAGIPLINYGKRDAMAAVEKYMQGDPAALGKIICDGIHRSVEQVVIQPNVSDKNTLPDYGHICGDLLQFVDQSKDPKLYDAIIKAGLTPQDIENAKICNNIAKLYDTGLEAIDKLTNGGTLTDEQKLSATADVAALRLTQQILVQRALEMKESPVYKKLFSDAEAVFAKASTEAATAQANLSMAERTQAPNLAEMQKIADEKQQACQAATDMFNALDTGYVSKQFGVDVLPNEQMRTVFSADNSPQGLHDMFAKSDTFKKISKQTCNQIALDMTQENAGRHLSAAKAENKNPVVDQRNSVQKNMQKQHVL